MKKKTLWLLWGYLYVLCVALGAITGADELLRAVMTAVGIVFFVPGAILLYRAVKDGDQKTVRMVRAVSAASLALTVVMLMVTFLSVEGSAALGLVMHWLLLLVSSPMLCIQYWVVSLFLWACLLIGSFTGEKK